MHSSVLEILLNKAGDKEDCLEDGVRETVFILYIKLSRFPLLKIKQVIKVASVFV